jgi:hypothetical protein
MMMDFIVDMASLRLRRPVLDVLGSNLRSAVLNHVPRAKADHEEAAGWREPTVGVPFDIQRHRQDAEHHP